jgi:hypothetical protein
MIRTRKFTIFFIFYCLLSLVISCGVAFTELAWLVYTFTIVPFYFCCILYCTNFTVKYRHQAVIISHPSLYLILINQILMVVTSPANCYGWHQGQNCHSFLQVHLENTLYQNPAFWEAINRMFFAFLFLHIVSMMVYLSKILQER